MTYEELIKTRYEYYPDDGDYKHPVTLHKTVCDLEYLGHQERCERFLITKAEYFSILMLEGRDYDVIQSACHTCSPNTFQESLMAMALLDRALEKTPPHRRVFYIVRKSIKTLSIGVIYILQILLC